MVSHSFFANLLEAPNAPVAGGAYAGQSVTMTKKVNTVLLWLEDQ